MSKNVKPAVIGMASTLMTPITTLAYNQTSNDNTLVMESSNFSRSIKSIDKAGVVTGLNKGDTLNVRSGSSTNTTSIGKYSYGETVIITGQDTNGWYRVDFKGKVGYVHNDYVRITGDISFSKTTENLNLRWGASTSNGIIKTIPKNTTVRLISSSNGWSKIYSGGDIGFVYSQYLSTSTTSSNTSNNNSTNTTTTESLNKLGQVTGVSSNDTLNIRKEASANSTIVGKMSNNTQIQVVGKTSTGWYKINYNGVEGYVNGNYIKILGDYISTSTNIESMSKTGKVVKTTDFLNVRSQSNADSSILGKIYPGDTVSITGKDKKTGWYRIKFGEKEGFVSSYYIELIDSNTSTNTTKKITTANVNLRTGAGTNYSIITTVSSGTVVEVISTSGSWSKVTVGSKTGYMSNSYLKDYSSSSSSTTSKPLYSKVKVVIDAGHGGKDSGAVGFGRYEKNIVLNISKKVNSKLKSLGFQTVMTRSTDVYLTLSERYSIANRNNADIFVSIHANSATSSSASGIETLYKNYKTLANNIQTGMLNQTGAKSRGLKYRSDLAVLNGTKMPSALVEVGFISNSSESAQIGSDSYQEKLATGIVNGIATYTDNNIKK